MITRKGATEATSRKKADVKDFVDAPLGSSSFISQIAMNILEHDEVLNTFALLTNRKVEIDSSQDMGDTVGAGGFGQNAILGKAQDYVLREDPPRSSPR